MQCMDKPKRYPKNVPGDFYVEDGCCLSCGVPDEAPELISYDDENSHHCYFSKQPENESQLNKAIKILWAQELVCMRYAGEDKNILRRLAEADRADICDREDAIAEISPIVRNHAMFLAEHISQAYELANSFYSYLLEENSWNENLRLSRVRKGWSAVSFSYSWYENERYRIWFQAIENKWHVFHAVKSETLASRGISMRIEDWLQRDSRFSDLKWFAESDWRTGRNNWNPTVI